MGLESMVVEEEEKKVKRVLMDLVALATKKIFTNIALRLYKAEIVWVWVEVIKVKSQSTGTPEGGAGGNGGPGRGYNYQSGSLDGVGGGGNSCPSCPGGYNNLSGGSCSSSGETGAAGGEWATVGENTTNSGNGGGVGRAITGSNYSVSGTINSSTVKGAYNP
jgi:hypothetical protein